MHLLVAVFVVLLTPPIASAQVPAPAPLPPVGKDFVPSRYMGVVVAHTDKIVTIKPQGDVRAEEITFHPDGTVKERRGYTQDNTELPRTFVFTEDLRYWSGLRAAPPAGGLSPPRPDGHKIGELQAGDVILIGCGRFPGAVDYYCHEVQIHRRPGARVPPARDDEKASPEKRWDNMMNAEQAREEKVIRAMPRLVVRSTFLLTK